MQRSQIIALAALGAKAKGALPALGRLRKSGKIEQVRGEAMRAVDLIRADVERVRLMGRAKAAKVDERVAKEKLDDAENRAAAKKARQEAGEE